MSFWIFSAVIGFILSITAITLLLRRYLMGEVTLFYTVSIIIGFLSFMAFILVSYLFPESMSRPVSFMILVPAIISAFILVHLYKKSRKVLK